MNLDVHTHPQSQLPCYAKQHIYLILLVYHFGGFTEILSRLRELSVFKQWLGWYFFQWWHLFGQSVFCIVIEKVHKEYWYWGGRGLAFDEFWVSFSSPPPPPPPHPPSKTWYERLWVNYVYLGGSFLHFVLYVFICLYTRFSLSSAVSTFCEGLSFPAVYTLCFCVKTLITIKHAVWNTLCFCIKTSVTIKHAVWNNQLVCKTFPVTSVYINYLYSK